MNPDRRDFLNWSLQGTGATALTNLLLKDQVHASDTSLVTHYPAKAKRVIHICLVGGMSHIDSFDPKPHLTKNQ